MPSPPRRCWSGSRAPRSPTSLTDSTALHAGFGVFNDIIPAQIADLAAINAPYAPTFVGGLGGQVGGVGIAPGVPGSAVDATATANSAFQSLFSSNAAPCAGIATGAATCPLAVSLNTFPTGTLKTPYYYQYNLGIEQQIGAHGALHVDYVGTRGLHEPFQVQLNGYQNVCAGCFAPYPYAAARSTSASPASTSSAPTPTAATPACRPASPSRSTASPCAPTTPSAIASTRSPTAACSPSPPRAFSPRCPASLSRQYGDCDYDVRHNLSAFGMLSVSVPLHARLLRQVFGGWSFSETAFLHSGLPFTVLSQPYTADGQGIFQASGPQFARRVPGVPVYQQDPLPWRHRARHQAVAQSRRLRLRRRSHHRRLHRRRFRRQLPVRRQRPQHRARPALHRLRYLHHQTVSTPRGHHLPLRHADVQRLQPSQLRPAQRGRGRRPWQLHPARFGTLESTISPPTGLLGVGLGGDSSPRMIAFQGRIEF